MTVRRVYQITLHYCCAAIITDNDIVVIAAPIFSWMRGKNIIDVTEWVATKRGTILMLTEGDDL